MQLLAPSSSRERSRINGLAAPAVANPAPPTPAASWPWLQRIGLLAVRKVGPAHKQIVGSIPASLVDLAGKRLIKGVKRLPPAPFSMMTEKADAGQVAGGGLRRRAGALTPETAKTLRGPSRTADVAMAEVEGGAPFESRFGGVNCRGQGCSGRGRTCTSRWRRNQLKGRRIFPAVEASPTARGLGHDLARDIVARGGRRARQCATRTRSCRAPVPVRQHGAAARTGHRAAGRRRRHGPPLFLPQTIRTILGRAAPGPGGVHGVRKAIQSV